MTLFSQHGDIWTLASDIHKPSDRLPNQTFTIGQNPMTGQFYLERIEDFTPLPTKIYGNALRHADRLITTFLSRDNSTGVLLEGEKGTGKTLLMKETANILRTEHDCPVIVINQPLYGEAFNAFLQQITQPVVVVFDEFEKVYDKTEQQPKLLTLFDGVYTGKKMFILTVNDKYKIDNHMMNRPGRIFYAIEYTGLEPEFILEYTEDNLNDKSRVDSVCAVAMAFGQEFSFDMLKAIIEEMNRYDEPVKDALLLLNANPRGINSTYNYSVEVGGSLVAVGSWTGNPLFSDETIDVNIHFEQARKDATISDEAFEAVFQAPREKVMDINAMRAWRKEDPQGYEDFRHWAEFEWAVEDRKATDVEKGQFIFENEDGQVLRLSRTKAGAVTHWAAY